MDDTTFRHGIHASRDVNQHAANLAAWDQRYEQTAGGAFSGRIEELQIGPVQVFHEQCDRAVVQQGLTRPDTVALALALEGSGPSRLCGRALLPGADLVVLGVAEFELVAHDRLDAVALDIDRAALAEHARIVEGEAFDPARLPAGPLQRHDPAHAELSALLLGTLQTARDTPALLRHAAMRRAWIHTACDLLLARLRPTPALAAPATVTPPPRRERLVREARAFMHAHAHEPLDVPQLCAVLGVSRRTLQYSFESVLQMSPVAYLRVLRLNGLRRDLQAAGPGATVADSAARWGFWHLPRLAGEYRALFGELPSQTLQRVRAAVH